MAIGNALFSGLGGAPSTATHSPQTNLPWTGLSVNGQSQGPVVSPFFSPSSINYSLWDKLLPYRLLVIDTTNKNKVVGGDQPSDITVTPLGNGTLAFTLMTSAWEFFLPITPQQLKISNPFAINTTATLRGILEEHSGVRFKNITIQGTFGIWPGRESLVSPPSTPNALQSIFGGTIAAAQNVATQFQSVLNAVNTGSLSSKPTTIKPGDSGDSSQGQGTGYYQTMLLSQFLEQYAEAKRNPDNAGWRLVFDMPKQNQSFVVTPIDFDWNENVNRPMEIDYTLQLKAWRRINLNDNFASQPLSNIQLSPGILQQVLNTVSAAQNTAAAAYDLIGSVRSDVDNVLNVIRQTGLFVKQLAGVAIAVSDLPSQLITDTSSTISTFLATVNPSNLFGPAATDKATLAALSNIQTSYAQREGLSLEAVSNGQLGSAAITAQTVNPANNVFTQPQTSPLLFGQVPVNNLKLNSAQQAAYENELDNVSQFTVSDLKAMRGTILTMVTQLETSFGAGDAYYAQLFNTPAPTSTADNITLDQYDILQSFYAMLQSYDILTATSQLDQNDILTNMEYVGSLAADSDIEFAIPNSKIQVPVPFGLTPEGIALRYLGDAQRWLEIATLNNLREPYIDENGFTYNLLSNGSGRNIVVGSNESLYVGQSISINSSVQSSTTRTILDMAQLSQTSFLLTLDGQANLDIYKIADGAYLKAYLPGTVNSQNVIFVPSDLPAPAYDMISIPTSVANVNLVGLSKVDWLLDDYGDLAVTNSGDFRLAAGITNLVQALKTKLGTTRGTVYSDPDFGLSFRLGTATSDVQSKLIYNQINNLITSDPRFAGIQGLQVNLSGPALTINLGVSLSGIQGVFPIGFTLPS